MPREKKRIRNIWEEYVRKKQKKQNNKTKIHEECKKISEDKYLID